MESRIHQKIDTHQHNFKQSIHKWLTDTGSLVQDKNGTDLTEAFLQFMYDYEGLKLEKEDFQRRKRVKNQVPIANRCCAKRANGEQCTRRWIEEFDNGKFCGTHSKGQPHGIVNKHEIPEEHALENVEVVERTINGIIHFVDKHDRVYSIEDIYRNISPPRVLADLKYDHENKPYIVYRDGSSVNV